MRCGYLQIAIYRRCRLSGKYSIHTSYRIPSLGTVFGAVRGTQIAVHDGAVVSLSGRQNLTVEPGMWKWILLKPLSPPISLETHFPHSSTHSWAEKHGPKVLSGSDVPVRIFLDTQFSGSLGTTILRLAPGLACLRPLQGMIGTASFPWSLLGSKSCRDLACWLPADISQRQRFFALNPQPLGSVPKRNDRARSDGHNVCLVSLCS